MRIAIAAPTGMVMDAGLGRYAAELTVALRFATDEHTITPATSGMRRRILRRMGSFLHRPFSPADLWHALDCRFPTRRAKRVVTVRDLAFLTHPACVAPKHARTQLRAVTRAVQEADAVITTSKYTRRMLLRYLPDLPPENVTAIPLGVADPFAPCADAAILQAIREKYALRQSYLLAVGALEPRNNYPRLLSAFAQAQRMPRCPQQLVIVGRRGWGAEQIDAAIDRLGVADRVTIIPHVTDADLAALYSQAACVAHVALTAESGLAALEALRCGAPLVVSDGGALPELVGSAAQIVPCEDAEALAHAIHCVSVDGELRHNLRLRGLARAAQFTWDHTARATLCVYEAVDVR